MSHSSAARLGGFSKERLAPAREINTNNVTVLNPAAQSNADADREAERTDFFIKRDGVEYAGTHLLVELWEAENLDNCEQTEDALLEGARDSGATVRPKADWREGRNTDRKDHFRRRLGHVCL